MRSPRSLIFAISTPKSGFWMLGDGFEVRKAASSVGFVGERPVPRRPHAGPLDIAQIRNLGLCSTSSVGFLFWDRRPAGRDQDSRQPRSVAPAPHIDHSSRVGQHLCQQSRQGLFSSSDLRHNFSSDSGSHMQALADSPSEKLRFWFPDATLS